MRPWTPDVARCALFAMPFCVLTACGGGDADSPAAGQSAANAVSAAQPTAVALTPRQQVNQFVSVVCPNEDSQSVMTSLPLTTSVEMIPEYHDCQRLIVDGKYGPLVGIFAHANVKTLDDPDDWKSGRLAATIVNFIEAQSKEYTSLGISPGTNCLVLGRTTFGNWKAAVIRQTEPTTTPDGNPNYGDCADDLSWDDVTASAVATELDVERQRGVDMKGDSIAPPVARWDWDPKNKRNYIGVKCDARTWCEIGPKSNFAQSPQRTLRELMAPRPTNNPRASVIKGYYDEQLLADESGKTPSSVYGTISPGYDATTLEDLEEAPHRIRDVARLEFSETDGRTPSAEYVRYVQNFKTGQGGQPTALKTVSRYRLRPNTGNTDHPYRGSFGGKDLSPDAVKLRKHKDHLHGGPPVVRWRWVETDELTWTYCEPDGCCENTKVLGQP